MIDKSQLLVPSLPQGVADQTLGIDSVPYYDIARTLDITSGSPNISIGGGGTFGISDCFFNMDEWQAEDAVVEFYFGGRFTTDAAAGTTTFTVDIADEDGGGGTVITRTGNEANGATNQPTVYIGRLFIFGGADTALANVSGSMERHNQSLFTTEAQNIAVDATTVNRLTQLTVSLEISSSDAGTTLVDFVAYQRVIFLDPNRSNVLEGGGA